VGSDVPGIRLSAFDTQFDVAVPCKACPKIKALQISKKTAEEHEKLEFKLFLDKSDAQEDTMVFLSSSDERLVSVPDSVVIPAGREWVAFGTSTRHLMDEKIKRVRVLASLGDQRVESSVLIKKGKQHHSPRSPGVERGEGRRAPKGDYLLLEDSHKH
jgi:hypothetical protein